MSQIDIPTKFVDKAKFVLGVFTDVEREYDFLLHLMTLTVDGVWRRRMLSKVVCSGEVVLLDLACGTGLVTFELAKRLDPRGMVVGLDLSSAMLSAARRNRLRSANGCSVEFVRAVGEFLPFRENLLKYITVGLALRNFADKIAVFRESLRVLSPSGWFFSLDFVKPHNSAVWAIYRLHIFFILPALARLVSRHWKWTMIYLANSIRLATPPEELCKFLLEVGFRRAVFERMSLGIVTLVQAQK